MSPVRRAWCWTAVGCGVILALVVALPALRIGVETVRARSALESGQALVGLLAGLLVFGRFRRSDRHADLVVAYALFLGASAGLLIELAATPSPGTDPQAFRTWAGIAIRIVSAAALAWAALSPALRLRAALERPLLLVWAIVAATLVPIAVACWAFRASLPGDPEVVLVDGRLDPTFAASAIASALVAALLATASIGFLRQSDASHEPLTIALALGSLLGAASWLLFVGFPTVLTDVVHLGDLLRFAFYIVLAIGAEREIQAYWSRIVRAAASDERRRMARDLHDGLAQELAFLARHTRLLARGDAPPGTEEMLISASDRALDEARRAISTLTARGDQPLDVAISAAAEDVAARVRTQVRIQVDPSIELEPAEREAVIRIVREAVGNAGRHGGATKVDVELDAGGVLRVVDDGCGFDTTAPTQSGRFGLTSMRERAEGVGGVLTLSSTPGAGTTIEVRLR